MIHNQAPPSKKAILMLSWEYPPYIIGGLARHVHALSIELVNRGHDIHVITADPYQASSYEMREGVHVHRVSPLNGQDPDFLAWIGGLNLAIADKAISIAENTLIHAVHTHDWLTGAAAEYISQSMHIPLVATIHGTEYGRNKGIFTEIQQFIFNKEKELSVSADKTIVCSEFMAEEVSSLFEIPDKKLIVIANGSDIDQGDFPAINIEAAYPFIKGKKVVFSIGRIVKEKGFDTLIRAASILKETHPEVCFVIAGNGPLLETYKQMILRLSLSNIVFFIGFVSDNMRIGLLQSCDLAVFPSIYEPFGLAAAEALAIGAPTIVSITGGLQGLVVNQKTGFYMEPGNEKSLADSIKFIIENEQLSKEIAERGKLAMETNFSWKQNAQKTEAVYNDVQYI